MLVRFILSGMFSVIYFDSLSQVYPVTWSHKVEIRPQQGYTLKFHADLIPGWHLYSQYLEDGGPIPTRITLEPNSDYSLVGGFEENGNPIRQFDPDYGMNITYYSDSVTFHQSFSTSAHVIQFSGSIEFLVCNMSHCIPGVQAFYFTEKVPRN